MTRLSQYLTQDHADCDALFADAENAVSEHDWPLANPRFAAFREATLLHFAREEDLLFPAFEAQTGMSHGPTQVMRAEHTQIRALLDQMAAALTQRSASQFLDSSETLLMLLHQHNIKEEQILYPMSDQALAEHAASLIAAMQARTEL
ncbi:MAG: hemerythrin domain-containing protein [Pseudomonadota bacterium]